MIINIFFYIGVMYYNIIVIQMLRVMAKRKGEQGKTVVIKEFATENKCHNI